MAIPIKDIVERVASSKGVEPVDLFVTLIGNLMFGSGYINVSPKGDVREVASIINELQQLMRMTQTTELPPSIYAAVELMAEFWVRSDRRNVEKDKANGTNRFPLKQLDEHEALLLILREIRTHSERMRIESNLEMEAWMKQYGVPPPFKEEESEGGE